MTMSARMAATTGMAAARVTTTRMASTAEMTATAEVPAASAKVASLRGLVAPAAKPSEAL